MENLELSPHPVTPVVELTTPQRNATLEQTQQTDRLLGIDDRKVKTKSSREMHKATQMGMSELSPNFKLAMPRLHSGAASDRPETIEISRLPPIPEVVWQQPTEIVTDQYNLNNTNSDSILKTYVASQTSLAKGTRAEDHVAATEHPPGNQTGNEPVPFLNCSKNSSTDIQNIEQHVVTTLSGDTTTPPLTTATPLIEEGLLLDEQTNEVYLPLTSTVVLKRKQEMLYVPLDFEKNLTTDALVDSEAFVSAID